MANYALSLILGCAILVTGLGCSGSRVPVSSGSISEESVANSAEMSAAKQLLFKVQYSGPAGSGSLRLILRLQSQNEFQISTADTLGRALWSLGVAGSESLFVDHREKIYCSSEKEIRITEVALEMFSVNSLPALLLGMPPIDFEDGDSQTKSGEFLDAAGRRWSVRREQDVVVAWTMFVANKPTLWWTRQGKGGILSHREGSQFRWRQVVEEPLRTALTPVQVPPEFRRIACDEYNVPEFRQDQPSSAGEGSSW